jgi:HEAT repeat protein
MEVVMANSPSSLNDLVANATAGDSAAIHNILAYLNAANPDLRHMVQAVLHASHDPDLWGQLLQCAAHECWPDPTVNPDDSDQDIQPQQIVIGARAQQSIVEAFVVDTSSTPEQEMEAKLAVLLPALESSERFLHWAAAYILGLRGNLRAVMVLDEILSSDCQPASDLPRDQCLHWQLKAIQALAAMNDTTCGPPLVKALASPQRTVHHAASQAISDLGRCAEPALLHAAQHPDAHVRWHAARALGQIGDLRTIDILADGLDDESQEVRWVTARVLGNLDVPAIPAILNRLVAHEISEPLRQSAFHALNSMYGLRQPEIFAYLKPLLDVLNRRTAISITAVEVPMIARRLLNDWKNVSPLYAAPPIVREDRSVEII